MNDILENERERRRADPSAAAPDYWRDFATLTEDLELSVSRLEGAHGAPLYVYEAGPPEAPPVVLINPAEAPFLLMSRLFSLLSCHFRVIAWDNPGSPFMTEPDGPWMAPTVARMSADLFAILAARGVRRPHVVSWCAGALVYLWSFAAQRMETASVSLIAPPGIVSRSAHKTPFQTFFLPLVLQLASGQCLDEARLARRILAVPNERVLLNDVDQTIFDLTRLPVRHEGALKRYAHLMKVMCSERPPAPEGAASPSYADIMDEACRSSRIGILHCEDDDIFSVDCSRDVAERHGTVCLKVYPNGGHFVLFKDPQQLAPDIAAFIRMA